MLSHPPVDVDDEDRQRRHCLAQMLLSSINDQLNHVREPGADAPPDNASEPAAQTLGPHLDKALEAWKSEEEAFGYAKLASQS